MSRDAVWTYVIPLAPPSLNHAYRTVVQGGHARIYLRAPYPALKEAVGACMRRQDAERGRPAFRHLDCTYLVLYPPEELYVAAVPTRRVGLSQSATFDEEYVECDISNRIKLVEDGISAYFQQSDTRVFDLHGHKRVCRSLPVLPARFDEELFGRETAGVLLLAVRESHGPILTEDDPLFRLFQRELRGPDSRLDLLTAAPTTPSIAPAWPEWYAPFAPESALPALVLNEVGDAFEFDRADDVWQRAGVRQRLLRERIAWVSHFAGQPLDWGASFLFDRGYLKRRWRSLAKKRTQLRPLEIDEFDRDWGWVFEQFVQESSSSVLREVWGLYGELSRAPEEEAAASVLVVGAGVGTYAFPFLAANRPVTVAEIDGSAVASVLCRRLEQCEYPFTYQPVASWQKPLDFGEQTFDTVVCCGLLDRLEDPSVLLGSLARAAKRRLVLSADFRVREGRKRSGPIAHPWVFDAPLGGKPRREWLVSTVTAAKGLGFKRPSGSAASGRLLDFLRR